MRNGIAFGTSTALLAFRFSSHDYRTEWQNSGVNSISLGLLYLILGVKSRTEEFNLNLKFLQ
jgi:hypothetical protein